MKLEAVILDWAGTTVDFGCFAPVQAFLDGFAAFGIHPTLEEVRAPMGLLKWDHIHTMMQMPRISAEWEAVHGRPWTREDVDAIYQGTEALLLGAVARYSTPKPYVLDAVAELRRRGLKLGSSTGFTDSMMEIVTAEAAKAGYRPDCWFTPDSTGGRGRPYPYMIFRNLEALGVSSVAAAVKVGDTVSDIREGQNAGLLTIGVLEGSSVMGLSLEEFEALTPAERDAACEKARAVFEGCGADYTIKNLGELPELLDRIDRTL